MDSPSPGLQARLAAEYGEGATCRQLAERYGVSDRTMRRWLHEAGVELRRTGPPEREVNLQQATSLREAGVTWRQTAKQVGMSESGLQNRLRVNSGLGRWGRPRPQYLQEG